MDQPNFHHLYYFWTVAREGSILAACRSLLVSQPTISVQLRALEKSLGQPLFHRRGRRLELTEMGRVAQRYADDIFAIGHELAAAMRGRAAGRLIRFTVGVADVVAKLIAYRLLKPALQLANGIELVCREGKSEHLLAALATHDLDMVLTDAPVGPNINVRAFSHLLGDSPLAVFGVRTLARRYRRGFPGSLRDAPLLLPAEHCTLRRTLNHWFLTREFTPRIVGQFEDSALLKAFGQAGVGVFFASAAIAPEIQRQYRVVKIGEIAELHERFYAISIERRIRHPAVLAISQFARNELFSGSAERRGV